MIDLQVSRKQIDEIDSQIVKLFEERMKVANEVAKYKMETGKAVFDKEREEQKLDSLSKICHLCVCYFIDMSLSVFVDNCHIISYGNLI